MLTTYAGCWLRGVSEQQIKGALVVALAFNVTDRLADAFDFAGDDPVAVKVGANYLLPRGYRYRLAARGGAAASLAVAVLMRRRWQQLVWRFALPRPAG
jgi:hypothetical protein